MAIRCGFFNAIANDRLYNALDFGRMFDGLIHDGVFATLGEHMIVIAKGGYRISVGTGKAWFNHTWTIIDSTYSMTLEPADGSMSRIDTVILEVNNSDQIRRNTIKIIKGELSLSPQRPTLIHDDKVNQYPLAWINVTKNTTEIRQADITNAIGTSECPFVTAVNQSVSIDELLLQWRDQFDLFTDALSSEFQKWQAAEKQAFDDWERQVQYNFELWQKENKDNFEQWWEDIVDVITSISVGEFAVKFVELQNYVKEVDRHIDTHEEYAQTFYRTIDYETHLVEPAGNTYGDFNDNVWLVPGIYVFANGAALKNTEHAPCNAENGGVLRVYDTAGSNIKELTTALNRVDKSFTVIQEVEYQNASIPKFRRQIIQTETDGLNVIRKYSKWIAASETVCRKNIEATSWIECGIDKYPYQCNIPFPGIDENWVADVYFDAEAVVSGKLASCSATGQNVVYIYAKKPYNTTIQLIVCRNVQYLDSEVIK